MINNLCGKHKTDPEKGYCATCSRIAVERKIVLHTARALIGKGYEIAVNDGEETTVDYTGDIEKITAALFTTDEDWFFTRQRGKKDSFVRFIYGNSGPDVINDYGMSLEPIMTRVNDFAERQQSHDG